METVPNTPPPTQITLSANDRRTCHKSETGKATFQHSGFLKPVELPGALSQSRGLEREAASLLPADELIVEVGRLQGQSWLAAIRETRLF